MYTQTKEKEKIKQAISVIKKPLARRRNPWPEPSDSKTVAPDYLGVLRTHHHCDDDTQKRAKYDGSLPEEEEPEDTRIESTGHSVFQKAP